MSTGLDESELLWERLSTHMDAFLVAWNRSPPPPEIGDYLPEEPSLRGPATVELIKIDLEHRCSTGESWPLERYMELYPSILRDGEPPCDLIYEEFQIRKSRGEKP